MHSHKTHAVARMYRTHTNTRKCTSDTLQWNLCYAVCRARASVCSENDSNSQINQNKRGFLGFKGIALKKRLNTFSVIFSINLLISFY